MCTGSMGSARKLARRRRYYLHALRHFDYHFKGSEQVHSLLRRAASRTLTATDTSLVSLVKHIMAESRTRRRSDRLDIIARSL